MIWTTAKSTEVKSRSTRRPSRSKTSGLGRRAGSAHAVTGLAMTRPPVRSGRGRLGQVAVVGSGEGVVGRGRAGGSVGASAADLPTRGSRRVERLVEVLDQ